MMICPRCQAEYRPGFSRCTDCNVELEPASSKASQVASHEPVEILSTEDLSLIPILRSILDGAEIPYEIRGDQNFSLQPAFDLLTGRDKTPILILVPADFADEARALLEVPDPSGLVD